MWLMDTDSLGWSHVLVQSYHLAGSRAEWLDTVVNISLPPTVKSVDGMSGFGQRAWKFWAGFGVYWKDRVIMMIWGEALGLPFGAVGVI